MEIPQEIFESAIQAACKPDSQNRPSSVEKLLQRNSVLAFPESKFLQLLVNSIQRVVTKTHKKDHFASFDFWYLAMEAERTLRVLQIYPTKNESLGLMFRAQLKQALLTIDTKDNDEVETLVNLVGEMRPQNPFNVGQTVINDEGE